MRFSRLHLDPAEFSTQLSTTIETAISLGINGGSMIFECSALCNARNAAGNLPACNVFFVQGMSCTTGFMEILYLRNQIGAAGSQEYFADSTIFEI